MWHIHPSVRNSVDVVPAKCIDWRTARLEGSDERSVRHRHTFCKLERVGLDHPGHAPFMQVDAVRVRAYTIYASPDTACAKPERLPMLIQLRPRLQACIAPRAVAGSRVVVHGCLSRTIGSRAEDACTRQHKQGVHAFVTTVLSTLEGHFCGPSPAPP